MKNLKTATPKEKQLQKKNAALRDQLAATREESDLQRQIKFRFVEEAAQLSKKLEHAVHANGTLVQRLGELEGEKAELEQTRQLSAESLLLERDELLVRVRRIEMRVKGLGFDV